MDVPSWLQMGALGSILGGNNMGLVSSVLGGGGGGGLGGLLGGKKKEENMAATPSNPMYSALFSQVPQGVMGQVPGLR